MPEGRRDHEWYVASSTGMYVPEAHSENLFDRACFYFKPYVAWHT